MFPVRKPCRVDKVANQVKMLTDDLFDAVCKARKHIMDQLICKDGFVFNLQYPGHKWHFLNGGMIKS